MARTKSPAIRREPSEIKIESNGTLKHRANGRTDVSKMLDKTIADNLEHENKHATAAHAKNQPGYLNFVVSVGCIYGALYAQPLFLLLGLEATEIPC